MILADSNIFIDMLSADAVWQHWSTSALQQALLNDVVAVNLVIAAELASQFADAEALEQYFGDFGIITQPLSWTVAHRAGLAHFEYRRRGGDRTAILADFLIGSHAVAEDARLLTRDPRRYRSYFPDLTLITPETHHG